MLRELECEGLWPLWREERERPDSGRLHRATRRCRLQASREEESTEEVWGDTARHSGDRVKGRAGSSPGVGLEREEVEAGELGQGHGPVGDSITGTMDCPVQR